MSVSGPKTVMVAMSGGVDSAVVAALFAKNPEVKARGVTCELFDAPKVGAGLLQSQSVKDAAAVAAAVGILHTVLNLKEVFEEKVIEEFVAGYLNGVTPNPCIFCNKQIKFGALLDYAAAQGCLKLATGHYACVEYNAATGRYLLKKAKDQHKDQTYMLCLLDQKQLQQVELPLGELTKQEVREQARELGLGVFNKPESQDICFVEDGRYAEFISRYIGQPALPGEFVNFKGEVLGKHKGMINYTVGQRRGLEVSFGKRVYVIAKNAESNTVVLGERAELFSKRLVAKNTNFIPFESLTGEIKVTAKIRYAHPGARATVSPIDETRVLMEFEEPQMAVAPGQAVAFYEDEYLVGGGIIE